MKNKILLMTSLLVVATTFVGCNQEYKDSGKGGKIPTPTTSYEMHAGNENVGKNPSVENPIVEENNEEEKDVVETTITPTISTEEINNDTSEPNEDQIGDSSDVLEDDNEQEVVQDLESLVALSVKNVTPSGLMLVIYGSEETKGKEINFGSEYSLQVLKDNVWEDVPYVNDGVAWTAEAYIVPCGESTTKELNWDYVYGTLESGVYKLNKQFSDFRGTGDFDTFNVSVEFNID